jgi:hypothetical protein
LLRIAAVLWISSGVVMYSHVIIGAPGWSVTARERMPPCGLDLAGAREAVEPSHRKLP